MNPIGYWLIIISLAALVSDGRGARASSPSPSTPGVAIEDPQGLVAKVKGMEDAHNRHDLDKELSFYAEDASFEMVGGWTKQGQAELRMLFASDVLLNNQLTFTDFKVEGDTVTCKVREQGDLMKTGGVAIDYDYAKFLFCDGLIKEVHAKQSAESVAAVNRQYAMFMSWAAANRPQGLAELRVNGQPQYTRESAAKWQALAREWRRARDATDQAVKEIRRHLVQKDYRAACQSARSFSDRHDKDAILLNELAWTMATTKGVSTECLDLAEALSTRANGIVGGQNPNFLDTLARVHFLRGETDKAIAVQQKAVDCASGKRKAAFERVLASYKEGKLPPAE